MSKNYPVIHYIQNQLKNFNPQFIDCIIRCFNYEEQIKSHNDCLTGTVALYVCAKRYGYDAKICYGLCSLDNNEFYHVWLEINHIIIDIAIYGNVNYSPYSMWDLTLETPYIGTYEESQVQYGKFKFDNDWNSCPLSFIENISVLDYINMAPQNAMWKIICKFMDETPSKSLIQELKEYVNGISFK